ncbi:hypothetical protein [Streptomyces sp. 7N604]|uniref:hypothetical protein n=1 Tax=Streptomyces sp. 7N604 TaxID=3457415 RepID=UPI003FD00C31
MVVDVVMTTPPATDTGEFVSVVDAWSAIEQVVPREQLAEALAMIAAVVPDTDGDDDAEWRADWSPHYGTVRGSIRLLVDVIDFGAIEASTPVVASFPPLDCCAVPCSFSPASHRPLTDRVSRGGRRCHAGGRGTGLDLGYLDVAGLAITGHQAVSTAGGQGVAGSNPVVPTVF